MPDLTGFAVILDALSQALSQLQFVINGFQQDCSAIGAAVRLVETGNDGFGKKVSKENSLLSGICG